MASYTTNLDLKKPAQSDKIRIADINGNMDDIDAAFGAVGSTSIATQLGDIRGGMAIVSTGDVHAAISSGQFVYVMNHSTLSDGLYTANSALAANATLSSSNVTAVSGGGLNALNSKITQSEIASWTPVINGITVSDLTDNVAVRSGDIVTCRGYFKVASPQNANAYIDTTSFPQFGKTRTYGNGTWLDNTNDNAGIVVAAANGNAWFWNSSGKHMTLQNYSNSYIYISYTYSLK